MKHIVNITRTIAAVAVVLCAQPVFSAAWAQQAEKVSVDSLGKHLKSHPKAKKAPASSPMVSAKTSSAKAKREVPPIILPGKSVAPAPNAKQAVATVKADSTPAVRRSAKVAKKTPR